MSTDFTPKYKHLWMVEDTEHDDPATGRHKSFWTKIGIATQNRDGSWSLELTAIPVNGRLQLRDPKPPTDGPVRSDLHTSATKLAALLDAYLAAPLAHGKARATSNNALREALAAVKVDLR